MFYAFRQNIFLNGCLAFSASILRFPGLIHIQKINALLTMHHNNVYADKIYILKVDLSNLVLHFLILMTA